MRKAQCSRAGDTAPNGECSAVAGDHAALAGTRATKHGHANSAARVC
jgi:hypothetical protein